MEKVYIATKHTNLVLVKTPMGQKDKFGTKIKSERAHFMNSGNGCTFKTCNPEMIKFLDDHEYMKLGKIQHFDPALAEKARKELAANQPKVVRDGVKSHVKGEPPLPPVPEEPKAGKPHKAKVRK